MEAHSPQGPTDFVVAIRAINDVRLLQEIAIELRSLLLDLAAIVDETGTLRTRWADQEREFVQTINAYIEEHNIEEHKLKGK
jgi:hypothetical protein